MDNDGSTPNSVVDTCLTPPTLTSICSRSSTFESTNHQTQYPSTCRVFVHPRSLHHPSVFNQLYTFTFAFTSRVYLIVRCLSIRHCPFSVVFRSSKMTLPIPLSIVAINDHMLCRRSATSLYKAYNQVRGSSSDAQPTDGGSP